MPASRCRITSRRIRCTTRVRRRRRRACRAGQLRPDDRGPDGQSTSIFFRRSGGSMVMIAKGNRGPQVTDACKKHGGFYLGSIGGPAAILAKENIRKVEVVEFPELGHGGDLEDRSGGFPGVHPRGRQRERLLRADRRRMLGHALISRAAAEKFRSARGILLHGEPLFVPDRACGAPVRLPVSVPRSEFPLHSHSNTAPIVRAELPWLRTNHTS